MYTRYPARALLLHAFVFLVGCGRIGYEGFVPPAATGVIDPGAAFVPGEVAACAASEPEEVARESYLELLNLSTDGRSYTLLLDADPADASNSAYRMFQFTLAGGLEGFGAQPYWFYGGSLQSTSRGPYYYVTLWNDPNQRLEFHAFSLDLPNMSPNWSTRATISQNTESAEWGAVAITGQTLSAAYMDLSGRRTRLTLGQVDGNVEKRAEGGSYPNEDWKVAALYSHPSAHALLLRSAAQNGNYGSYRIEVFSALPALLHAETFAGQGALDLVWQENKSFRLSASELPAESARLMSTPLDAQGRASGDSVILWDAGGKIVQIASASSAQALAIAVRSQGAFVTTLTLLRSAADGSRCLLRVGQENVDVLSTRVVGHENGHLLFWIERENGAFVLRKIRIP